MRELGSSNKVFYYNFVGRATFNMQITMQLLREIDPGKLRQAVDRAMPRFPEFAIKPVFRDGHLCAEENRKKVVIRKEDHQIHRFAEDDTNGFLFYFSYDGPELKFSCFHGLADFKGYMVLLRTILYEYALEEGTAIPEEAVRGQKDMIRFSENDIPADESDVWDPYGKYAEMPAAGEEGTAPETAAVIHTTQYPEESSRLNCYEIICSASAYAEKVKALGTSSAALLTEIASEAAFRLTETDRSRPVVGMLPVDLRRLFGSRTLVNFSDGVLLPLRYNDLSLPLEERCRKIRSAMKAQICREFFASVMAAKVQQVKDLERAGAVRESIEQNISLAPAGSCSPLTYAVTVPGSLSMGPGLDELLTNVTAQGFARASSVVASSFAETMRILITYRSDDPAWADAVFEGIRALGLDARMKALGRRQGDILMPESFL